jgi:hypothetical protein
MTGVIHVLDLSQTLPHGQDFYDEQATAESNALLSDDDLKREHQQHDAIHTHADRTAVTTGRGEIVANGGGPHTLSVMRFMEETKVIHAGETIECTNFDAVTPHTITFGVEPFNAILFLPSTRP